MIDLLVAGGGPAGLVTALHAARSGLRTAVIEPRPAPIDKACGEGLMPPAVAALHELGLHPVGMPLRGIRYLQAGTRATAAFGHGSGLGVRRTELHRVLHRAVESAGIPVVTGAVHELVQDAGTVTAAGLRARYLAAADGLHSPARRQLLAADAVSLAADAVPGSARRRWGMRAHFPVRPWTEYVEVHWAEDSEAYVTPVGEDCVGVAVLGTHRAPFGDQITRFPSLLDSLGGAEPGPVRGAGPMRQQVARRVHGRVLLVGDAAGYVDALTGEGLALAFACAEALVSRVVRDEPQRYEHDYLSISRRYRLITESLLWAARHDRLRRRIVPMAARLPWLFGAAVAQLGG